MTSAVSWLEGGLRFVHHDAVRLPAVYMASISFFFLFPLILLGLLLSFLFRSEIEALRVYVLSVLFSYLISLPFFLFFPVLERWTFPGSGAILLSDLWSSRLIEAIRPISGLDNCFPSSHAGLTVIAIMLAWIYKSRFRLSLSFLGATVLLSTLMLGIHWIPDLLSGIAVALISVSLARHFEGRMGRREI